ncbi:type IV secretion system protein [Campylobacter upsaliensis]|uniref:Virulence protein n=1 Tax=Campylobacter upsaliensis TaxID=28080 RepID=A0A5L4SRQ2_CAMUP|nr:type IV secretion system protein [Campylobacter upsaliensis]EAI8054130.1 type IV secretion system protein [Campylobacter upsaliensis]EAJ4502937.1 type IV secretion system protein [Campylobacter upsaliensis]EAJ5079999.1 type IV secretion system protein [Campylobacter upsaliensis]EAK0955166.1 type IV secretion system protein [Campylobacter upsaliensis]EAK2502802.1 type IV secretion system protein [Campylobacter upsaliensis]
MTFKDDELSKDPNHIFALERNMKQYLFVLNIVFAGIIILLIILFIILLPLKEEKPYLVFFSDSQNNFVRIEPANFNIRTDEALLKGIIAGYVIKRETINRIDDIERYEEIRNQSNSKVWNTFSSLVSQGNSIYSTRGIYRDIKIINSSILSKNIATVDFTATIIHEVTAEKNFKRYRATLNYDFTQQTLNFDSLPKNPTGFIVNEYALTEVDLQGQVLPQKNKDK